MRLARVLICSPSEADVEVEKTSETATGVTFFLSGRISPSHVPELNKLLRKAREEGRTVTLDLGGCRPRRPEGGRVLPKGEGAKSKLLHCPVYVSEWLRCEGRKVAQ